MASPSALYASATAGRDLLPLPKYTLPAQKGGGRSKGAKMTAAQKRQAARLRKSLLSVHDGGAGNRDDSQGPSSSSSSSTSSSSSADAHWLRNLSGGQLLPNGTTTAAKGERLLGAINRMEKYLTRDVLLRELMSKDTVEQASAEPMFGDGIGRPYDTSLLHGGGGSDDSNSSRSKSNSIINDIGGGSITGGYSSVVEQLERTTAGADSSNWLLRESRRLPLVAGGGGQQGNNNSILASGGAGQSTLSTTGLVGSGNSASAVSATNMVGGDPVAAMLGLPTIPDRDQAHLSKKLHQNLIGAPEQSAASARNRARASTTLPASFSMPSEMVDAVSNFAPFRDKLYRSKLTRGDWVAAKEAAKTEEREQAAKLASANVVPPFWNPHDTETVIQYGRGGDRQAGTQCVARYDYNYEAEHAAVTIQRVLRGHMMRLDVFKPWGARDRWQAIKIQRQYRRWMAQREYRLLRLVMGIQGTYRDPYCRTVQRVWRGIRGRRRFARIRCEKYAALIKIQTQWRMLVARERVKFRKMIRNKWCARNIQRVFRGHFHGRMRVKQKKFVRAASQRLKEDPACLWGLVHLAMRLHVLRHDWRRLPNGYLSDNSPAAWHKVVRKPRLEAEGLEGTLIRGVCLGTKTRLLSHALYQLKRDKDNYCISLFPPRISANSYILNLGADLPTGRGAQFNHVMVASMYQLSSGTKSLVRGAMGNKFVIEAFDPETSRECVPYIIEERLLQEAAAQSKHGAGILEGGRRIVDLRPWIVHDLRLVKTAQAQCDHGVRVVSPILERARRRVVAINAVSLLQRRIRGRGGKLNFAIAQSRQRERMRQVAAALARKQAKFEFKVIRDEAAADVQRAWHGTQTRRSLQEKFDKMVSVFLKGGGFEVGKRNDALNGQGVPEENRQEEEDVDADDNDSDDRSSPPPNIVFKGRRVRVGGGLRLKGTSVGQFVDGIHASGMQPGRYLYVTCTQNGLGFDLAVSEEAPKDPAVSRRRSFMETDEDVAIREAQEKADEEAKIKFRGRIEFAEILPLLEACPMLNFESLTREALLIRLLSLCEIGDHTGKVQDEQQAAGTAQPNSPPKGSTKNPPKRKRKSSKAVLCQHGRGKATCQECNATIGLGSVWHHDADEEESENQTTSVFDASSPGSRSYQFGLVTIPVSEHAFRLGTRHLSVVTRGFRIAKPELNLKTVALNANTVHSEQKLSLDVGSLAELKEGMENGEEERKETEKLFSRIRQDVVQQFQWLRREQKKAERAQNALLRDLKNANNTLEKRAIACKMAKAAANEFEAKLKADATPAAAVPEGGGGSGEGQGQGDSEIAKVNTPVESDPLIQKKNNKKLRKLKTLVKKEEMLLQAAEAAVNSKGSLASIYEDFAVAAEKGLALGSKLKDTLLETLTSCNLIRARFNDLIQHQKDVILGGLSHEYDRLSCLRLACTSVKDLNRLRDKVMPMCRVVEKKYHLEAEVLQALHMRATRASTLQAMAFRQIEGLIEAQRDNDLDLMALFEQELASWKTIAFEGPRSEKGKVERDRVGRTKKRRVQKETARIELARRFDGAIRKRVWDAFVVDADGMVGRVAPPPKFRKLSVNSPEAKQEDEYECGGGENKDEAVVGKSEKSTGKLRKFTSEAGDAEEDSWEPRVTVASFRTQYFKHKEIHFDNLVEEAQRVPSFSV